MTLTEFLPARIAEDEAAALATQETHWESYLLPDPGPNRWQMTGIGVSDDDMGHRTETMFPADAAHIARHDPARVLAECEAKRLRLAIADTLEAEADDDTYRWAHSIAEQIRKVEALPYADHPDYREEWAV